MWTFLPIAAITLLTEAILLTLVQNHMSDWLGAGLSLTVVVLVASAFVWNGAELISQQIERAVWESEERFSILVDSLEDHAIFMLNPDGMIVTWNAAAERIIGYTAAEVLGKGFSRFYVPEDLAINKPTDSLKLALKSGSALDQGWRLRRDGTRFWAEAAITPLFDESGRLRGYANVTRDITERKQAEEALRQKSNFVQLLQMVASAANEASTIEQAMRICLEKVCRQNSWAIGHSFIVSPISGMLESANWYLAHPRFQKFMDNEHSRRFESGEGLPGRVLSTGNTVWISDVTQDVSFRRTHSAQQANLKGGYAFPVKVGGEVVAVLEFFSEIVAEPNDPLLEVMGHIGTQLGRVVERTRSEAALRESEMRFRSVAQSAKDAIVSCNRYGLIISWNKGARSIFGFAEEEMLGMSLSLIVPDFLSITGDARGTLESTGRNKAGHDFPIELSVADWKIGEDAFFTVIIRDIELRKESEAHISASLREKDVLLKEIHHRVKNNLQIISSLLRLQSQYITDARSLDMFRESQNRVKSMALIHEYLYQSRDMARINFSEYLGNLTSHLFRSYGVTDTVRLEMHVDDSRLDLDTAIPCGLIITELVSNSLKHAFHDAPNGLIRVDFHTPDGKNYELSVKDNGIGMPAERLTEPKGSLGLRLVTTLAQQLSGMIHVEQSQGTKFVITFKVA
jgi:PAS domain S-box-containing protein